MSLNFSPEELAKFKPIPDLKDGQSLENFMEEHPNLHVMAWKIENTVNGLKLENFIDNTSSTSDSESDD